MGAAVACAMVSELGGDAVTATILELEGKQADEGHRLKALGAQMAALPLEPRLGKLVVVASVFGDVRATNNALTTSMALSTRPWLTPLVTSFVRGELEHMDP